MRLIRNSPLEQGNVIDLFVRRCNLWYSKLSFGEMEQVFTSLIKFLNSSNSETASRFVIERKGKALCDVELNYSLNSNSMDIEIIEKFDHSRKIIDNLK